MWTALALAIVALPCAMLGWFTLEVFAGLLPNRGAPRVGASSCRYAIIIPAHDEELVIGRTLARLLQMAPASAVLVVADNCTDRTAMLARQAGVQVIERHDSLRRGKGFALDSAREALRATPLDVVMVLDADCTMSRGSPLMLCERAHLETVAVQAENTQEAARGSSPVVRLGAFAFFLMNVVRAGGLERLGGSALLQGTGMALPWSVFADLDLASGDTVEDLRMSTELARAGVMVRLDRRCAVTSQSGSTAGHLDQRRRWELGSLDTGRNEGFPLLGKGLAARRRHLVAIGAHLLIPPLALLFLVAGGALAISLALQWIAGAHPFPAVAMGSAIVIAALFIFVSWQLHGRTMVPFSTLALAPLYVVWKLPIYLSAGRTGARKWNRAERLKADGPIDRT